MPVWVDAALRGIAVVTMGLFFSGPLFRFRPGGRRTASNRAVLVLGALVVAYNSHCLLTRPATLPPSLIGGVLCASASGIFIWAWLATRRWHFGVALAPDVPRSIAQEGPFRWVRHPTYLSYFLGYLGAALVVGTPASWVGGILLCLFYLRAAIIEERLIRKSALSRQYAEYSKKAGMFFPRWVR